MAKVKVSYKCGCGYSTENLVEAIIHSDLYSHSLSVLGTIAKDKKEE